MELLELRNVGELPRIAHAVDEELPVQVVELVLEDGGHEAPGGDGGAGVGSGYGGALYYDMLSSPTITECDFIANEASDGRGGSAGRMASGTSWGGDWDAADATVDGYGYSPDTIAGGAIFMDASSSLRLDGCNFYDNRAYE